MRLLAKNVVLGSALIFVPLVAEVAAMINSQAPGSGIEMLLYWPLNFGLFALAVAGFLALNVYGLWQRPSGPALGLLAGLVASATWIGTAVLLVFQVHLWRGGQL